MKKFDLKFKEVMQNIYDTFHAKPELNDKNIPYIYINENDIDWNTFYTYNDDSDILFENRHVYRTNNFNGIINFIRNMNKNYDILNKDDLHNICHLKTYGKWKNVNKRLLILKYDFSNFEFLKDIFLEIFHINNIEKIINVFNNLQTSKGAYMPFSNIIGIMFVSITKTTDNIIKHEIIHFIQDVTGNGIISTIPKGANKQTINTRNKFIPIEYLARLKQLNTFSLIQKPEKVFKQDELIPYINNICYFFEKNHITGKQPLNIINNLIKYTNELKQNNNTVNELINHIQTKILFASMLPTEFAVLIICLVYKQHQTLIKTIIGNYFK